MRILIVGTPRSGTMSLMNGIANILKLNVCCEPFLDSNNIEYNDSEVNMVLKTMVNHTPFSKIDELRYSFDKTILLSRKDINASWESVCNALYISDTMLNMNPNYNPKDAWVSEYVHTEASLNPSLKDGMRYRLDLIIKYSFHSDIDIIWYEDLFSSNKIISKNTFDSIGLNIPYESIYEYLNPSNRYRK